MVYLLVLVAKRKILYGWMRAIMAHARKNEPISYIDLLSMGLLDSRSSSAHITNHDSMGKTGEEDFECL